MNLQKEKINSYLVSHPRVLLSFHTTVEFHSVAFHVDNMISVLEKKFITNPGSTLSVYR